MSSTPPHLAEPELTYVHADGVPQYMRAVALGFHETYHDDTEALDATVVEPDRFFGYQVDDRWIATCGAFSRRMTVPGGRDVAVGAVTVVTVAPSFRRRGLLTQMMRHQLDDVRRRKEPMAILWASESVIYGRFGYGFSAPRTSLSGRTGSLQYLPTVPKDDGSAGEVDHDTFVSLVPAVHESLLPLRVGALNRGERWWPWLLVDPEWVRNGSSARRYLLHYAADGAVDGFATFRIKDDWGPQGPNNEVQVGDIDATHPAAYAALWRYLLDIDLVRSFSRRNAPVDERLRSFVGDPRRIETKLVDGIYVRVVDVPASLEARTYAAALDVVIEIDDSILSANSGRYRLQVDGGVAKVSKARRKPDLSFGIRELGTIYLGGTSLGELAAAGLVHEHTAGAVAATSTAFGWPSRPFCPDGF